MSTRNRHVRQRDKPSQIIARLENEILGLHRQLVAKTDQQGKDADEAARRLEVERQRVAGMQRELTQPHRVLRIIEYVGPRKKVEEQVRRSLHGTREYMAGVSGGMMTITAVTLHEYPETFEDARRAVQIGPGGGVDQVTQQAGRETLQALYPSAAKS